MAPTPEEELYPTINQWGSNMPIYLAHKLDNTTTRMGSTKQSGKGSVVGKVWNPPFCQDSKEFKFLVGLFRAGKNKLLKPPAAIRSRYLDTFGKFTTTQFWSQFSKARNFAGVNCK
jgi:hypothetical protein